MTGLAALAAVATLMFVEPALRPAPTIDVPRGWRAEIYATGLKRPTALAFGPDGLLYATQETGEVVAVGPGSSRPRIVARGFDTPLGLAWSGRTAFVSARGELWRLRLTPRIDLNSNPMLLTVERGRVLEQVRISPEMCQTWLKYVAPLLAEATEAEGKFSRNAGRVHVRAKQPVPNAKGGREVHASVYGGRMVNTMVIRSDNQPR